ncbi:MAG: DUF1553 domain-containing protein [Bacteroidota bacterium]
MRTPYSFGFLLVLACCGLIFTIGCQDHSLNYDDSQLPDIVDFNFHIKPILSDRCFSCHGPDENKRKTDLRLDEEASALDAFLESGGHAFVAGRPEKSEVLARLESSDPDFAMPPPSETNLSVTDHEIALIRKWVEQGATYKKHWAFIPPQLVSPLNRDSEWARNDIDRFILDAMQRQSMLPNIEADTSILIRRLFLDVIGLPPSPEEMDAFLAQDTRRTYEDLLDSLLASPHFGERMAIDWLDVSRYADSHGYSQDGARDMYPWRDWVIQAFNDNMPFDQFILWQMAGDQVPHSSRDQQLATAFLRHHRINGEGGIIPEEYRVEYVADRTQTTATAFLGLTLECARCHDHKYDPVSQKEYYQLSAFFNQVNEEGQGRPMGNSGPEIYLSDEEVARQIAYFDHKISQQKDQLAQLISQEQKTVSSPTPPDLSHHLLAHLDFEQGIRTSTKRGKSSKYVPDTHSRKKHLIRAKPEILDNERGKVLKCGSYDMVSIDKELVNFRRSQPFSFSFWLQGHPETESIEVLHKLDSKYARQNGFDLALKEGKLCFRMAHSLPSNLIEVRMEAPLSPEEWAHITLTYDGSSQAKGVQFFLNGQPAESTILFDQLQRHITSNRSMTLGGSIHLDETMDDGYVLLDELRVYDKALTVWEVASIFNFPDTAQDVQESIKQAHHIQRSHLDFLEGLDSLEHWREKRNQLEDDMLGVMVMEDQPDYRPTYVLNRGVYDAYEEEVYPGTPQSVLTFSTNKSTDRYGLARWLVDPANPLPSRVLVNRLWRQVFGRGLVASVEDFGNQGDLPSHPELLDWLAVRFMESGWDVKAMLRLMLSSATYRQSSLIDPTKRDQDPDNMFLARGPSYRLSAELLRDQVLKASGLLVDTIGGPSVKPYQPEGLWSEKTGFSNILGTYIQDHGDKLYRRSLYTFWRRTSHHPVMSIFDAPTRDNCIVRRETSNTPLQALAMMNETQFLEAAKVLAARVMQEESDRSAQIALSYRLLTSCVARPDVIHLLLELWQEEEQVFAQNPDQTKDLLDIGEYVIDADLSPSHHAAMTVVCSNIMNFDETVTKR